MLHSAIAAVQMQRLMVCSGQQKSYWICGTFDGVVAGGERDELQRACDAIRNRVRSLQQCATVEGNEASDASGGGDCNAVRVFV